MKTVLESLQSGAAWLERRGVPEARLNMEHMLAHVLDIGRLDLYVQFDRPLGEAELAPLRDLLRRRGEREPLQHLLGTVDFGGHVFISDKRALIPRPETEDLLAHLLADGPPEGGRVIDIGCGSGVLGLSLAAAWKLQVGEVLLVDLSPEALALAGENARRLDLEERVSFLEGDLLAPVGAPVDLVVANLPYIPSGELADLQAEVRQDPVMALDGGADGLRIVERLLGDLPAKLLPGGRLALELGEGQAATVAGRLSGEGYDNIRIVADDSGIDRFVFASKK